MQQLHTLYSSMFSSDHYAPRPPVVHCATSMIAQYRRCHDDSRLMTGVIATQIKIKRGAMMRAVRNWYCMFLQCTRLDAHTPYVAKTAPQTSNAPSRSTHKSCQWR
jgi:hypothetical protein